MQYAMNARLARFLLCSLCLHIAVSWLLLRAGSFEHGMARESSAASTPLSVRIVPRENAAQSAAPETPALIDRRSAHPTTLENAPAPAQEFDATPRPEERRPIAMQDYLTAGQLTRRPIPLTEIDLNVAEISELAFTGEAQLIVLIDADGVVADVIASGATDIDREFAVRVAARFKQARFRPGEINGKAVNSQLKIKVVSERLGALDAR